MSTLHRYNKKTHDDPGHLSLSFPIIALSDTCPAIGGGFHLPLTLDSWGHSLTVLRIAS